MPAASPSALTTYGGGADVFVRLFRAHPAERVLRFLDGSTTPAEDLAVMRSAPRAAMVRAALRRPAWGPWGARH